MLSGMDQREQRVYMGRKSRTEYMAVLRVRYKTAGKQEKGRLLGDAVQVTGMHRKALIRLLKNPPSKRHTPRTGQSIYTAETKRAVRDLWHAGGEICAERLHPFMPDLLDRLVTCGELMVSAETDAQLRKISLATVKRIVAQAKRRSTVRIGGTTKPGSLLKAQITVRYGRWNETSPGWCETDTVAHCGETLAGTFIYSLNLVDVATSWSEQVAIMGKGERACVAGLDAARQRLPFPLLGLDSDNGSEFINWHMQRYCQAHKLTLTRSRPYRKNDNAYAEQKNWTAIRQLVGYVRLDTDEQLALLNDLYANGWRLYLNCFQPTMKVQTVTKDEKTGKKTKQYYQAQTPYQRLMEHPNVTPEQKALLQSTYDSLNPLELQQRIHEKLERLRKTFR